VNTRGAIGRGLPPVLAYHKVGTAELGGTWCSARQLDGHLDALAGAGWTAIDLAEFEARLDAPVVARSVLLTFDDAFESFERHAWPLFERRGWPVVLFVVTEFVGRRATWDLPLPGRRVLHLDWPALRALAAAGVVIGSHGARHRDLRRLPDAELERELAASRHDLEDRLGSAVRALAYPFGRSDGRVRAAVRAAGYACAFSTWTPPAAPPPDRFALRRHGVYVIDGRRSVLDKVDAARTFHRLQEWSERAIHACAALAARAG